MDTWMIWLLCAAALIIVELLTQWVSTFCLAIGSITALVLNLCGVSVAWQLVGLAIGTIAGFVVFMPYLKQRIERRKHSQPQAVTGMDALIGRTGVVTHPAEQGATGRVKIDGDNWQVRCDASLATGDKVRVIGYDSIILSVEKL